MRETGPTASWLTLIYTVAFVVTHVLFADAELGLSILTVHADYMHCKHLGSDQYFLGGVFHTLVYDLLVGIGSPMARVEHLWRLFKDEYKRQPSNGRFNKIHLAMFVDGKKPWEKALGSRAVRARQKNCCHRYFQFGADS